MKANNYEVVDAGETIKFRGIVARSLSQALFLSFCTFLGLISLALVLQIQFQHLGEYYYYCYYFVRSINYGLSLTYCTVPVYAMIHPSTTPIYRITWFRRSQLVLHVAS